MNLRFSRTRVWKFIALVALANVAVILATIAAQFLRAMNDWKAVELGTMINLLAENNVAVWYSGMLFLTTALAMAGNFAVEKRSERSGHRFATSYGWLVCAAAFAGLSLDEMGSLHERVPSDILPSIGGVAGWPAYLALPLLVVAAYIFAFTWRHLRHRPVTAGLMVAGLCLFILVPVQEHIEALHFWGDGSASRPLWMELLEEGSELFGGLAFLAAALTSIADTVAPAGTERSVRVSLNTPLALACIALLGFGLVVAVTLLPGFMDMTDGRGITANWFPSAAAFIVALFLLGLSREEYREQLLAGTPAASRALGALGVAHLFLSADHGAAHHLTEVFLEGNETRRRQLDVMLVVGLIASGAWAFMTVRNSAFRAAVAAWAALQLGALVAGVAFRPTATFLAYSLLLLALPGLMRAREAAAPAASSPLFVRDNIPT